MRPTTFALLAMLQAPDVKRLLESGPDGSFRIRYAVAPDVCATETSLRIGSSGDSGDGWAVYSNGPSGQGCDRGPAVVLVTRNAGRVTSIRIGVGASRTAANDLGLVSAPGAARAFLAIASEQDGRVGREAVLAAIIADSADVGGDLLALARGGSHSRGLRETAVGWVGRAVGRSGSPGDLSRSLGALAGDRDVPESVRTRAAAALGRSGDGAVAVLVELATRSDAAVAMVAVQALARVGGAGSRRAIRTLAGDGSAPAAARLEAIKALGNRDAVPEDLALLRRMWPTLLAEGTRHAALDALGEAGGADNARWLAGLVADTALKATDRARAVRAAERAGTGSAELTRLYQRETDRAVKMAVLEALGRIADRTANETIRGAAERDTDPQLRRAAVRWLSRAGGEEGRDLLRNMVER